MDMLEDGMNRVLEGTLSSADYTVICRGAKVRIDLYRLADEEMEAIRAEETQTAAEEIAGAHGDPRHPQSRRRNHRPPEPVPDRLAHRPGPCNL